MFLSAPFNSQVPPDSASRDPTTGSHIPRLAIFPPVVEHLIDERRILECLNQFQYDDCTGSRVDHNDGLTPETTSATLYPTSQHSPYQQELDFGFPSPSWSTTESNASPPAHVLNTNTPGTSHSTPFPTGQHLRPYDSPPTIYRGHYGADFITFGPPSRPWLCPATIPSPSATDASPRDITRDIHATRPESFQLHPSPSSLVPATSPPHEVHGTALQLTLHQPKPIRANACGALHLLSSGSVTAAPGIPDPQGDSLYGTDGQLAGINVGEPTVVAQPARLSSTPAKETESFACPRCSKSFTRPQDVHRHLKTVHADGKPWTCCGVPLSEAHKYKISAEAADIGPVEYEGMVMIGGCGRGFARKDTYGKHLRWPKSRCVGDVNALYHPENANKVPGARPPRKKRGAKKEFVAWVV